MTALNHPMPLSPTRLLPGLVAVFVVTVAATLVADAAGVAGPLAWAMLIGLLLGPTVRRRDARVTAGTTFASRTLLRVGVALLGFGISIGQAVALGPAGLAIAAVTIAITLTVTIGLGRRVGVDRDLTLLIGVGTSVCGASAIAATTATTEARRSQIGYAVATVTIFGTVAMLALPPLARLLGMDENGIGIWIGASIQEVAQVTAAGAAVSAVALKAATLVKLIRVTMLAAVLVAIRALRTERPEAARAGQGRVPLLPAFIVCFLAFMAIRSLVPLPDQLLDGAGEASRLLQTAALAGIGLQVDLAELRAEGARPLLLGLTASAVVVSVALAGALTLG